MADPHTPATVENRDRTPSEYFVEYDEDGSLALARALAAGGRGDAEARAAGRAAGTPCKASALDGSWFLQLRPRGPHALLEIRGPMRVEVAPPRLRVSGDIYVRKPVVGPGEIEIFRPITDAPLLYDRNWYPQLSFDEYSWYFRSLGVTYAAGELTFKFERHLWNPTTQEFINRENSGKDNAFLQLVCTEGDILTHPLLPAPTLRLTGAAQIGGETYDAVATKTSPFYRGCAIEVDAMKDRAFPVTATSASGAALTFASIYRTAGIDCAVTVDQTELALADELSPVELQTALRTNRRPSVGKDAWRLWILIGLRQGRLLGIMFDDEAPFREGVAGFYDSRLPDLDLVAPAARGQKVGDVTEAFLRTLVHEAGHAFNLFHPKHDVHNVPIGTTIMNQTADVQGFAAPPNLYPANITFAFDDHNRTSLIHAPDPQVAPGWKPFGWGHGSLSSGITEPVDAAGFLRAEPKAVDLALELAIPEVVFRGEFVAAEISLRNTGAAPIEVTSALNLSEGDLRLLVKPPAKEIDDVRDVIVACGDRPTITLAPGETLRAIAQIFYTNVGFTFRQTGRYLVSAELSVGDGAGTVARSLPVAVVVASPHTAQEEDIARLTMIPGVGRAFALGDYGMDHAARSNLEALVKDHGTTPTGRAAALLLANAHARAMRDIRTGETMREADEKHARKMFEAALDSGLRAEPSALAALASAVAAPVESDAPIFDIVASHLAKAAGETNAGEAASEGAALRSSAGRKGRKTGTANAAPSKSAAALDLLERCRRSMAGKP